MACAINTSPETTVVSFCLPLYSEVISQQYGYILPCLSLSCFLASMLTVNRCSTRGIFECKNAPITAVDCVQPLFVTVHADCIHLFPCKKAGCYGVSIKRRVTHYWQGDDFRVSFASKQIVDAFTFIWEVVCPPKSLL